MRLKGFLQCAVVGWVLVGLLLTGCSGNQSADEPTFPTPTAETVFTAEPRDYGVPAEDAQRPNPIPADGASIQRGRQIYETGCGDCHGPEGHGDGPAAVNQNPKPVDFSAEHIKALTDGELFYIITNGVDGTAMMAFPFFEEEQRWHLVNYIRSLQE